MSKFTGGDHLKPSDGLKYYIHRAMMLNELGNGEGAYKISNAKTQYSGPSFGGIQYDIGQNSHGRQLLEQIARQAKDAKGNRIVSDNEISQMQRHLYKPFSAMSAVDNQVYKQLEPKLNQALRSSIGMHLVNKDYDKALNDKVKYVVEVIDKITQPENKQFVQNSMQAQVFIADMRNQYGPAVNHALEKFLNQTEKDQGVKLPGAGGIARVKGKLDMEDLKHFRMQTVYAIKSSDDIRRRNDNIERIASPARQQEGGKPASQSKGSQVHSLLRGLLNDKDGSYANNVLADHPEQVARFEAKLNQSIEHDKLQQVASRENQALQQAQEQGVSRSIG